MTLCGIDLVGYFAAEASTSRLRLITAAARNWWPDRPANLVTCVHGLHYVGDKLALLAAMLRWLTPGGKFVANFDPHSIRHADGSSAARRVLARLRAAGLTYDARRHLLTAHGPTTIEFRAEYLGADNRSGPGYTGQPAVTSYYNW
ncbi:class I SAM-dependent methyltransferase [Nocardia stercoris]|uniref:Class I SAM-dependent methyltransferase n=1 Tax=Nocardia stercoris TaxID=2483361 RepID=A0A3M2L6I6_9NOCA|nr:class I SAM-dependent methyltransferase [Nocardia stercoris]RMI32340.1 class I SAM-dependent methyltransferase [Nocardia stercoris]